MGFCNPDRTVDERASSVGKPANADLLARGAAQALDFNVHLERFALCLAQTWKDNHPDATAHLEDDLDACILVVTTKLAIAANATGDLQVCRA